MYDVALIDGEVPLDDKRTRLLLYVVRFHAAFGRGPSYGELHEVFGHSKHTLHRWMKDLRDRGLVDWKPHSDGTLRPLVRVVGDRGVDPRTSGV